MRCLITNDDGYDAPGLLALDRALRNMGHKTIIVAPLRNQSGVGSARTFRGELRVLMHDYENGHMHVVDGTPVDCVEWGMSLGKIDMVCAGVNHGDNTGRRAIMCSGTVAAAALAAENDILSVALSQYLPPDTLADYGQTSDRARVALEYCMRKREGHKLFNVNLQPGYEEERGIKEVRISKDGGFDGLFRQGSDGRYRWQQERYDGIRGSDSYEVTQGYTTITRLNMLG